MSTLHRRQFVKLASSGLLIASAVPVSSALALPRPSKDKVGVALLGLGNYSTRLLAPALQAKGCRSERTASLASSATK